MTEIYEDIEEEYEYAGKIKKTGVRYFPDVSIATITKSDLTTTEIINEGMNINELQEYFPPLSPHKKEGATFNLAKIIRSIIYEAFLKEGIELEEGNVRNFWYTHLKHTITKILGLSENDSVLVTVNTAWDRVINSGLVTYEGMNIRGGKESFRISIVKDSPFSNIITAVEKIDYFDHFKWIPKLFNCTLITAGGQSSRTVARAFIKELKDIGVDLNQQFYMAVASDLDPAGYYIQEAFRKQLEAAIKYYGGSGKVHIRRLFVRKDQVSEELLKSEAMPCSDNAETEKAMKAEETKWQYFHEQTDGGIYIPIPYGWEEYEVYEEFDKRTKKRVKKVMGKGPIYDIDGKKMVRALLEMNAFSKKIVEKAILRELLKIIEETSDESKIMIPEIMRIFELMRERAVDEVYDDWYEKLIKPLIDSFLDDTERWRRDITHRDRDEEEDAEKRRDEQYKPIDKKYDDLVDEQKQEARDRVPDLYNKKEDLERQIKELENQLDDTNSEIKTECEDIFDEIKRLDAEREDKKEPIGEKYEEEIETVGKRREYREKKLDEFKDEHSTVFNPIEMQLKLDVGDVLDPKKNEEVLYYFTDLEKMAQFKKHIARLLTDATLLLEDDVSCFEHPIPTFNEEDLLKRASERYNENVENVRNAFPQAFTDGMITLLKSHVENVEFELTGEVEEVDLTEEIENAMEETEKEIDEGILEAEEEEEDEEK